MTRRSTAADPSLDRDAEALQGALSELIRVYQFRDRDRICCHDISVTQCYVLESLAREGAFNLHVRILAGSNNHHKAEAIFKSLARSLRTALSPDDRRGGEVPSTKGTIG